MEQRTITELRLEVGEAIAKYPGISGYSGIHADDSSSWTVWSANKKAQGKLAKWYDVVSVLYAGLGGAVNSARPAGEFLVSVRADYGRPVETVAQLSELSLSSNLYLTLNFIDSLMRLSNQGFGLRRQMFERVHVEMLESGLPILFYPDLQPRFGDDELSEDETARLVGRFLYLLLTGGLPPTESVVEEASEGERLGAFDSLLLDWVEEHKAPTGVGGLAYEAYEGKLTSRELSRALYPHFEKAIAILESNGNSLAQSHLELTEQLASASRRLSDAEASITSEEAWLSSRAESIEAAEIAVDKVRRRLHLLESLDQDIAARLDVEGARGLDTRLNSPQEASIQTARHQLRVKDLVRTADEIDLDPNQFWPSDPRLARKKSEPRVNPAPVSVPSRPEVARMQAMGGVGRKLPTFLMGLLFGTFVAGGVFLWSGKDVAQEGMRPSQSDASESRVSTTGFHNAEPNPSSVTKVADEAIEPTAARLGQDVLGVSVDQNLSPSSTEFPDQGVAEGNATASIAALETLADLGLTAVEKGLDASVASINVAETDLSKTEVPEGMRLLKGGLLPHGLTADATQRIKKACLRTFGVGAKRCNALDKEATELGATTVVAPFFMDETEVSYRAYKGCIMQGACPPPSHKWNRDSYPVTGVNPLNAKKFCAWRKARLPLLSEWQFAVRGQDVRKVYPWGEAWLRLGGFAPANMGRWFNLTRTLDPSDGSRFVAVVNSYKNARSVDGLLNLVGNVEEFVLDQAGKAYAVGGGFLTVPFESRVTLRREISLNRLGTELGFRCARGAVN